MITTIIGKTFLKAYNEQFGKDYSAKEFFVKEYFELFFNHPKYMQWVTNSPFVQMKKGQKPELLSTDERLEKLMNLHEKVSGEVADASFAIGYPASGSGDFASTSGLVSDIITTADEEDIYFSWIGSGLGIGVAGGYNLLIDDAIILMEIYEGWMHYRKYLNDPTLDKLRGNQINTWNGQWLTFKLGNDFVKDFDFRRLQAQQIFSITDRVIEVNTVNWSNLFFSLSNLYPNGNVTAYVYSFGQTNKTLGFIPLYLRSGSRLRDVWRQLYGNPERFNDKEFQSLFGMHIKRACETGSIGLHALRPEGLKKYMDEAKNISFRKEEDTIIYQSYKTWLIAMMSRNKEEITDFTENFAELILRFRKGASGTDRKNLIEQRLFGGKTTKKVFLDALTEMVAGVEGEDLERLKGLRNDIHLMTNEEFGYFNTLLKFDYAYLEKNS
ncbi:MAG: hypothetical protein PHS04_05180 [Tissierellia bacterium]|nr:hypothetical protein [Proteiniphilum sp.]MDD4437412.1 hypothetical protein [Tissierellia bacterium]